MRVGTRTVKVGTCGSARTVAAQEFIPCYTCIHFQAWVDAPHEQTLNAMLEATAPVAAQGRRERNWWFGQPMRSIRGVRAVIAACNARKAELGERHHG